MSASYRADIDGLRAVAILAVLAFHAWPGVLPGGFIGVDVFFVISGYLITGLLLGRQGAGGIRLAEFYARRARRLLPALTLVLGAVLAAGWVLSMPAEFAQVGRRVVAAAAFSGNLSVLADRTGYFAAPPEARPLMHLWSLGVEEQFYLGWPLLLAWLARRADRVERAVVRLAWASLALSVLWTALAPVSAFYVPFTRFWELLAGAWIAVRHRRDDWRRTLRSADVWVAAGVGLIVIVAWRTPPAWPAWVPAAGGVAGAMAVVFAGSESGLARRTLGHPAAVWLGLISYPLYLWHWPIQHLTLWPGAAIDTPAGRALLSILAAAVTYHWWERPLRRWASAPAGLAVVSVATVIVAVSGALVWASGGVPSRLPAPVRDVFRSDDLDEAWQVGRCFLELDTRPSATLDPSCVTPAVPQPIVAVWGDSHAAQFVPGLRAASAGTAFIAQWTASACTPLPGLPADPPCQVFRQSTMDGIVASRPRTVVIAAAWKLHLPDTVTAMASLVTGLRTRGVRDVVVAGASPFWPRASTLFRRFRATGVVPDRLAAELPLSAIRDFDAVAGAAVRAAGGRYVSLVDQACDDTTCRTLVGSRPISIDGQHVTVGASILFADGLLGRPQ